MSKTETHGSAGSRGWFDGSMPRETLEYYLSHAVSAQWLSMSDTLEDDIRVILKTGIKFCGRAAGIWNFSLATDNSEGEE